MATGKTTCCGGSTAKGCGSANPTITFRLFPNLTNGIRMKKYLTLFCLGAILSASAQKFDNLASTPPMGWNSWNKFGCDINEQRIRGVADATARRPRYLEQQNHRPETARVHRNPARTRRGAAENNFTLNANRTTAMKSGRCRNIAWKQYVFTRRNPLLFGIVQQWAKHGAGSAQVRKAVTSNLIVLIFNTMP